MSESLLVVGAIPSIMSLKTAFSWIEITVGITGIVWGGGLEVRSGSRDWSGLNVASDHDWSGFNDGNDNDWSGFNDGNVGNDSNLGCVGIWGEMDSPIWQITIIKTWIFVFISSRGLLYLSHTIYFSHLNICLITELFFLKV